MQFYFRFATLIILCIIANATAGHHGNQQHQIERSISKSPSNSKSPEMEFGGKETKGVNLQEETGVLPPSMEEKVDDKALVNHVLNIMQMSKSNEDIITQAFRFVRLDAHLSTLMAQLSQLRESQEVIQTEAIKRQTKFNVVLDEIRLLAGNVAKESVRLTEIEERLESEIEMMNDRIDSALEKIIQSAVSTQLLLDLSKETIQQTDKSVGISNEILMELKNVRTELGDVGQASVQTIYNVQKMEESLLTAMGETGNKTIQALHARQDQQLQYQVLPLVAPSSSSSSTKTDIDQISLIPLGSVQADETISQSMSKNPKSLDPDANSASGGAFNKILGMGLFLNNNISAKSSHSTSSDHKHEHEMDEEENIEAGAIRTQIAKGGHSHDNSISGNSAKEKSSISPPCPSPSFEKRMEQGRPRDCKDIQIKGHALSGVYRIFPDPTGNATEVYCDMNTDGGGWTVIQRRKEPLLKKEDFEKGWDDYVSGFGILHDSHFLGLDVISRMTEGGVHLRVDMTDWSGESRYAHYNYFRVANSTELFKLFVTDYSGNAGDSLSYHNEMKFTTRDRDNDLEKNYNCAEKYSGAWWYKSCHQSNLNGIFIGENNGQHSSYANGINWYSWHGYYYSLKRVEMKIRVRNDNY